MPEGHTLLRLALDLDAAFGGRHVRVTSPQGRFEESAAILDGRVLRAAEATGKHLFLDFDQEDVVHVHLGLYGKLAGPRGPPRRGRRPAPVGAVRMRLVADGADGHGAGTAYGDLRGATQCALVTPAEREAVLDRIGPDPLKPDADPDRAWQRIRRSRAPIGGLLMDQSVLAGVGNVYRAEVLFRHRLDPMRPGRTLRVSQWQAVWDDLVELMAGGRAQRPDRDAAPRGPRGGPPAAAARRRTGQHYVYRRDGQAAWSAGRRCGPGAGRPEPVLVPALPARVPLPRRRVSAPSERAEAVPR